MDEVLNWLRDYNIIAILFTMIVTILNTILIQLKIRKSKAEKDFIKASREVLDDLVPADYLAFVNGRYYSMNEVLFVRKDDISLVDYLNANGKEVPQDEKENESSC